MFVMVMMLHIVLISDHMILSVMGHNVVDVESFLKITGTIGLIKKLKVKANKKNSCLSKGLQTFKQILDWLVVFQSNRGWTA